MTSSNQNLPVAAPSPTPSLAASPAPLSPGPLPGPIPARRIPGPRGLAAFRKVREIMRDPLGVITRMRAELGEFYTIDTGVFPPFFMLTEPEAVRHVLVDNARNYVKSRSYDGIKYFVGQGLLTSEGDFWRRARKMAQPAFHRDRIAGLVGRMAADTARMLESFEGRGEVDIHTEMLRLTLAIVGDTLFGTDLSADAEGVGPAITTALHWSNDYALAVLRLPLWLPTPANRRFRRALAVLDAMVQRIIDARRQSTGDHGDLMSMLMAARDEDSGQGMNDRQLRDEVMTMVGAGHETTANATSWLFHTIAQHPEVEERLRAEARSVLGDRPATIADLPRLSYTLMVVQETLRLYPPVWMLERTALAADTILGRAIAPGCTVGVSPYLLHRNARDWPDPDRFDPDRFLPAAVEARGKFVYLPFSTGPRVCIGNQFALMEAQVIVAMVLARYRLVPVPGHLVQTDASMTLRPRNGVPMRLERL